MTAFKKNTGRPEKGFIKELSRSTQPRQVETKKFSYKKDLTPKQTSAMNTPRRLSEMKSVKPDKTTDVCREQLTLQRKIK